jgi:hypothetical protein
MYALDLPACSAVALVAIENQGATWHRSMNGHPKVQMTELVEIKAALDGATASLPGAAWIARRGDDGWRTEDLRLADSLKVSRILGWLAALEIDEDVFWTAADGFQPRAGALGLLVPVFDYTLAWADSAIRRVIVGAPSPFGQGVFVFDGLVLDMRGYPHPCKYGVVYR